MDDAGSNRSSGRFGRPARVFLGLGFALASLVLLELLLGFLPLDRYESGFPADSYPVFTPGQGTFSGKFVTNPHFSTSMNFQTFDRVKARGTTRIFFLGSSAAMGWPGSDPSAFTGFLRRALDAEYPGRFEIINVAGLSYASHRVLDVLLDVVDLEPDLVVVYSGNNEYVERNVLPPSARNLHALRIRRVLRHSNLYRSVRLLLHAFAPSLFARPEGPDLTDLRAAPVRRRESGRSAEIDREVLENYRRNLSEIVGLLGKSGIPGLVCTVPVNLSEWVPAERAPAFPDARAAGGWDTVIRNASDAYRGKKYGEAEALFGRALELSPRHAPAHFYRGDALRRLARHAEAREEFLAACELDDNPIRDLPSFRRVLLAAAAGHGIPVVDLEEGFAKRSPGGLVGLDLFIDYCHPNEAGHKLVAELVLAGMCGLPGTRWIDAAAVARRIRGDTEAARYYYLPNVLYARGMTLENNGDIEGAERCYRETLGRDPSYPEALSRLGVIRFRRGERKEAEELFRKSLAEDPGLSVSLTMMALLKLQDRKFQEAREYAARVLGQAPAQPTALEMLGDIAAAENDWQAAIGFYARARSAGGDHGELRGKIARAEAAIRTSR